jgi:hypothetical protein
MPSLPVWQDKSPKIEAPGEIWRRARTQKREEENIQNERESVGSGCVQTLPWRGVS